MLVRPMGLDFVQRLRLLVGDGGSAINGSQRPAVVPVPSFHRNRSLRGVGSFPLQVRSGFFGLPDPRGVRVRERHACPQRESGGTVVEWSHNPTPSVSKFAF